MRFLAFEESDKSDDGSDGPAEDSEEPIQTVDGGQEKDNSQENTASPVAVRSPFCVVYGRSICISSSIVGFYNN
jgi:hypothetical protein